ncbi:MAG: hypothetical protein U9R25_03040 [Chloroflexota bacterium]|nr:hypothetical protein [Chloroflexota bacterium]
MREIQTFVLRLLVDTDEPHALRGVLRAVVDDEEHSFTDEESLLPLLLRMSRGTVGSLADCDGQESSPQDDDQPQ